MMSSWMCHLISNLISDVRRTGPCSAQCFRVAGETESGPAALQGFCLLKSLLTRMERDVFVVVEEGSSGVGKVWVRTVQLSFKSTVELVQVVGQARVVDGVGGSGLVVSDLPKPSSDRSSRYLRTAVLVSLSTAV